MMSTMAPSAGFTSHLRHNFQAGHADASAVVQMSCFELPEGGIAMLASEIPLQ